MIPLADAQIHVWHISLHAPARATTLSSAELERAARFHFEWDRTRFIVAHTALREILSGYTNIAPPDLTFQTGIYGKPSLSLSSAIQFNLSHSHDRALLAVARGMEIGVDIELSRQDVDIPDLSQKFFSQREIAALMNIEPRAQHSRFFELWTRKEAFLKAIGMGVSFPLPQCDVCDERVRFDAAVSERDLESYVQTIPVAAGFAAAVATPLPKTIASHFHWSDAGLAFAR